MKRLEKIYQELLPKCSQCPESKLHVNQGHGKLKGWGTPGGLLIVGLNPSRKRDENRIFSNKKYEFFLDLLKKHNKNFAPIYITNLVKCSTEDNKVKESMIGMCELIVFRNEFKSLKPKAIMTLGTQVYNKMSSVWHEYKTPLINIHHPSYIKRMGKYEVCENQIKEVFELYNLRNEKEST